MTPEQEKLVEFAKAWLKAGALHTSPNLRDWPVDEQDRYHRDLGLLYHFITDLPSNTLTTEPKP